jgi:hypothetical protein
METNSGELSMTSKSEAKRIASLRGEPMKEFIEFPKIARLSRPVVVTEKLDGTNACVFIGEDGEFLTASRTRWITPDDDNHGFAKWAQENREELMRLGPGQHFGEWWGSGIQRRYGLDHKRFSLFNTHRWSDSTIRPLCCDVVPVLYSGNFETITIAAIIEGLRTNGSVAAPGFMKPEGIVAYHTAAKTYFKKTLEKDDERKGAQP